MTYAIEYQSVTKHYEGSSEPSVNAIDASIAEGEFITILGSSGCGKTTLLKMTNRLIEPTKGKVILFGEDIAEVDPTVVRRRMGYVIQQVGLFPHMTIAQNIGIMLKLDKKDARQIDERVHELLELVGLDPAEFSGRYPSQLSGGQQQRVGLARALVSDPKIMLLDEPFGALDAITRSRLQGELKRLHEGSHKTFLLVTHDIVEALTLGTRVMVIDRGRLQQFDTPEELVQNPKTDFVKQLVESARASQKALGV